MPFTMKKAYTIKEAQRGLAGMVRTVERGNLATITRHDQPVAYVIGAERLAAIAETMEILANPAAMKAIRAAEAGTGKVYAATDLPA
jgi:prevent-host-death family protein